MKMCWANWGFVAMVIVLGTLSMLSGCGQTGDLYLEDTPEQQQRK